ncbi:MAG TPA: DUF4174 domain-containing protein [Amaricoccus sp.]|uniref:DUF4174 domain-containing protein n=1 Tax=Amaricoccus sp. TaxID=1872485 RepID=UPI002C502745|nr:DUF4174 domain-containing protein [Amaricoccus sp.]HMQ91623.1 DUF4174 domain-containing protein [Amaricoccus sp.]HMR51882.1 DUF4174 domain-containing protein [Amaricoccus sp.]HMR59101.1 DUF4174 domain-containing protein [Amaricoccus sp.]HMT98684.1 DUF4174 domain-containing protein [Amaricoccus sp.]
MPPARLIAIAILLAAGPAAAQDGAPVQATATATAQSAAAEASEQPALEDLLWVARPIVVFADTPNDPRFQQQMRMLDERAVELAERDVVILTDTDPAAKGPLRTALRPRGFNLVLIDIDGTVAQRRPAPTTARELINLIDRMPSRRQETGSRRQ